MSKKSFQFNFELKTNSNSSYTPFEFSIKNLKSSSLSKPSAPLKYLNEALIAMNYNILNDFNSCDKHDEKFINTYIQSIDPYFELFQNSSFRLKDLVKSDVFSKKQIVQKFEKELTVKLSACFENEKVNFKNLTSILKEIEVFEKNLGQNLIYNFNVKFSEEFNQKLISFYSFLFHTRTLSAHFYNQHIDDAVFESVKCDSINDYLAKTDYTVNDALIYWQFKKLSTPFNNGRDIKIEKLFVQPLENAFLKYNNNACSLINNLPESFLTHQNSVHLEESLYQVQMDWLLGSGCGLLFRIREELFGLENGYDQIFWPESDSQQHSLKNSTISYHFEIMESDFIIDTKVG